MIIVLSAILAFISFPFLMSFACMDAGMGPGGLGCLGVGIGYTIVAFVVFVILGVMLNSRFKNKVQQENDDKPFDLSQIKEDKYHDIIRYYTMTRPLYFIDWPLSVVADTALLPINIPRYYLSDDEARKSCGQYGDPNNQHPWLDKK